MSSNRTRLQMSATRASLSFVYTAQNRRTDDISECVIHFVHPWPARQAENKPRFFIRLSNQTCSQQNFVSFSRDRRVNFYYFDPDYEWDRVVWTGCEPRFDPLPEVLTFEQEFWVSLHLADVREDHLVLLDVSSSTEGWAGGGDRVSEADVYGFFNRSELEVVHLSRRLGYMQSPGYNPESDLEHPEMLRSSSTLWLPAHQALMLSFRHFHISCHLLSHTHTQEESAVSAFTLTDSRRDRLLWRRCGTLPPLPKVVVEVEGVTVEMRTARHSRRYHFRQRKSDVGSHTEANWIALD